MQGVGPAMAGAYEAIASIHRSKGRYEQAIAAIDKVCILQPNSADAWTKMAMMRYLAGLARRGAAEWDRARKVAQVIKMIDAAIDRLKEDSEV